MERITDAWDGLERREKILALVAVGVLVVVVLAFLLLGGKDPAPVDASTAAAETTPQPPGLVAADPSTVTRADPATGSPAPTPPQGVAGLTVSSGGEVDSAVGPFIPDNTGAKYPDEQVDPRRYQPPVVSDAIRAAGRELERVAKAYHDCVEADKAAGRDSRHCLNETLKGGVYIDDGGLHNRGGMTFTKQSSDGHSVVYVLMQDGSDCRALDGGRSCDAWTSN